MEEVFFIMSKLDASVNGVEAIDDTDRLLIMLHEKGRLLFFLFLSIGFQGESVDG